MDEPNELHSASVAGELAPFLERIRAETGIPGIAVALSAAGERTYASAGRLAADDARPLSEHSRFHLGCVVKLLLAVATLELARSERIELNAPIGRYIGELAGTRHGEHVRVRHLLSHTSGYRGTNPLDTQTRALGWRAFVDYLRDAPRHFEPGAVFSYEHSETVLLERLLANATVRPPLELVRELLLEPLGIGPPDRAEACEAGQRVGHHTYEPLARRFVPHASEPAPEFWRAAFSDRTLALGELIAIGEALCGGERVAGPVGTATRSLMSRRVVALPPMIGGPLSELLPIGYGLGAAHLRDGWLASTGVAHGQCIGLRFDPAARAAVAVGINAVVPQVRDLVLNAICRSLSGTADAPLPRPPLGFELGELAGSYAGPGDSRVVAVHEDGRLVCEIGSPRAQRRLRCSLVVDAAGRARLDTRVPQLVMGCLREPGTQSVALMLGLNAYKHCASANAAASRTAERPPP